MGRRHRYGAAHKVAVNGDLMARNFLIIDGYNLMHAAGLGRTRYGPGDLKRCRSRLLKQLENSLAESALADTIVVFDGASVSPSDTETSSTSAMKVRYSPTGSDADTEIERLLRNHSSPRQVIIVSSDHRLHKAARARRALAMDSEDFWRLLHSGSEPWSARAQSHSADRPAAKEQDEAGADYTEEFLKIDVTEIKRSVGKDNRKRGR